MITLQASSIDELNALWRRLRSDFQVIENIHLDPKSLQYRMVIKQPDLTAMLKGVADKVLDRLDLHEDRALEGLRTFSQFDERVLKEAYKYKSLDPVSKIWEVISVTDKKAIFAYLRNEWSQDQPNNDSGETKGESISF